MTVDFVASCTSDSKEEASRPLNIPPAAERMGRVEAMGFHTGFSFSEAV